MKYYKILNEQENSYGYQFKTGLNENPNNPVTFRHGRDYISGGFHFASNDIFAFLYLGHWIREVILPVDAKICKKSSDIIFWKSNKIILGDRKKINLESIVDLIQQGADYEIDNCFPFRHFCSVGELDIVKYLISKGGNIFYRFDETVKYAEACKQLHVVEYLKTYL
jgi:hypothetical protein